MAAARGWWTRAEELWGVQWDYQDFVFCGWIDEWEFPDVWEPCPVWDPDHPGGRGLAAWSLHKGLSTWGPETVAGTAWRHDRFKRWCWPPGDGSEGIGDVFTEPMDYAQAVDWVRGHWPRAGHFAQASDARWDWLRQIARSRRGPGRGRLPDPPQKGVFIALMVAFLVYAGIPNATRNATQYGSGKTDSAADAVVEGSGEVYKTVERHWGHYKRFLPAEGGTPYVGDARSAEFRNEDTGRLKRGYTARNTRQRPPKEDTRLAAWQVVYAGRGRRDVGLDEAEYGERRTPPVLDDGDRRLLHTLWIKEWLACRPGAFPPGEIGPVRDLEERYRTAPNS